MNSGIPWDEMPGCDTGPGGRLLFVVSELRGARTARRRHRTPLGSGTGDDTDTDTGENDSESGPCSG